MTVSADIRPATVNDAPAIAKILSDWIDETAWMPRIHTREEDQGFGRFLLKKTDVVVAEVEGQVAGFLAQKANSIAALYLASDSRGQKIGSCLLARAKMGSSELTLWTFQANTAARAFYAAHGFVEVERTEGQGNDEKLPDVRCVWTRDNF